ncbi:MAG: outer membrane beta-barrel protein [Rickettsiales bacterium]|jgi:opacity protein-like surface antigen|nr:outer membrane beta-barrel protein [Rickettsiales bacterium]
MNKKFATLAVMAVLASTGASAGMSYMGFSVGSSSGKVDPSGLPSSDLDTGAAWSIYGGFALPVPLFPVRAEVEYIQYGFKDADKITGFGVNAYVGLPLIPVVKPYLGLGATNLKPSGVESNTSMQYMIGLDLDIPMMPLAGGVEYRYIPASFEGDLDIKIHSFLVKGRVYF